mmetsp:Transcript_19778/g.24398  ORF Transcript_19778/g.24398 Transcript_19778/m.24398 type:complete len:89 (+) Transcript_19778:209-475(+)
MVIDSILNQCIFNMGIGSERSHSCNRMVEGAVESKTITIESASTCIKDDHASSSSNESFHSSDSSSPEGRMYLKSMGWYLKWNLPTKY